MPWIYVDENGDLSLHLEILDTSLISRLNKNYLNKFELGTAYCIEVFFSPVSKTWELKIDGLTIDSGSVSGTYSQNFKEAKIYVGDFNSTDSTPFVIDFDNIVIRLDHWPTCFGDEISASSSSSQTHSSSSSSQSSSSTSSSSSKVSSSSSSEEGLNLPDPVFTFEIDKIPTRFKVDKNITKFKRD